LPPGVNPIAVDKYINININISINKGKGEGKGKVQPKQAKKAQRGSRSKALLFP